MLHPQQGADPGFFVGGGANTQLYFSKYPQISQKLYEIKKILDRRVGRPPPPPLGSPNDSHK